MGLRSVELLAADEIAQNHFELSVQGYAYGGILLFQWNALSRAAKNILGLAVYL